MLFVLLFSVLSVSIVKSEKNLTITWITPDQVKNIGDTVELSCSVSDLQDYVLLWLKLEKEGSQNSIFISTGAMLLIPDSRISVRHDSARTTYTLQIKDIQYSDAGLYKCQIFTSQSHKISKEVRLQVHSPLFFYDNSSSTVVVSENQQAYLECYADGVPKPQISWKRENGAILPTGGPTYEGNILKFNGTRREDRGTYYCIADNKVGRHIKINITVEVEFAPIVRGIKSEVSQALNHDAELECRVEAYPAPQISWSKGGIHIGNSIRYKILHFPSVDEFTYSMLRVLKTDGEQYGTYVCQAVNKLGSSSAKIDFKTSNNPVCPPACGSART